MKNKQILGALALDLKRVALGYYRGSNVMADKFYLEALKRRNELDNKNLDLYREKFDVVIAGDGDFEYVNELLSKIMY